MPQTGLTPIQKKLKAALTKRPQTPQAIAAKLDTTGKAIGRNLSRLQEQGHAVRNADGTWSKV